MAKPQNIRRVRVSFDLILPDEWNPDKTNPHKWNWYELLDLGVNESMNNLEIINMPVTVQDWRILEDDWGDCWEDNE